MIKKEESNQTNKTEEITDSMKRVKRTEETADSKKQADRAKEIADSTKQVNKTEKTADSKKQADRAKEIADSMKRVKRTEETADSKKQVNKAEKTADSKKQKKFRWKELGSKVRQIKNTDKSGIIKIVAIFVVVVFVCTILSRAASSFLTPHVETSKASSEKIEHTVISTGTIEALREVPIYIYDELLVDEILVDVNDSISKETPLLKYNQEMLEQKYEDDTLQMALYVTERADTWDKREITSKMEKLQDELDALEELISNDGILYAEEEGKITAINVKAGERSTDTAAFSIADISQGFVFVATVSADDIKYIAEGDSVMVNVNNNAEKSPVTSIVKNTTKTDMYDVYCELSGEEYNAGMYGEATFTHQSEKSGFTIPIEAVRSDSAGSYVLVVGYKDTILGEEMVAKKVTVEEADSNNTYAVVTSSALNKEDLIIINSDKSIEAGDVVRYED